jgi:hypothetical protein
VGPKAKKVSEVDCSTGRPHGPSIAAEEPPTFTFEKRDFKLFSDFGKKTYKTKPTQKVLERFNNFQFCDFEVFLRAGTHKHFKNFGPRKVGLQSIFRLRIENLYVKAGPSLQHQPAVALFIFMATLGLNDQNCISASVK